MIENTRGTGKMDGGVLLIKWGLLTSQGYISPQYRIARSSVRPSIRPAAVVEIQR